MNGYKTRSQHEHSNNHSSEPTSMATCYENAANSELTYNHSSGSYNVLQPFNSYPPSYFEPQASMTLQPPEMHSVPPPLRHDQQHHFNQYSLRQPGYMGPSGYPPETSRFVASMGGGGGGFAENEVESQDSINENTMLSEPINPPLDGFPHVEDFDRLMESYVNDLSVKKQDKALINARRARNIRTVLADPKDTAIGSAQFRFWVKKMFKLEPADSRLHVSRKWICHEGKPVAIREKLFKILTRAHQQCQHGGRDKTSSQVRQIYSWVPKELISRFVKICPTCQVRRGGGGSHLSPPDSRRNSPPMELSRAQQQAPLTYLRAQPTSPIAAYDEYRRNSSSSYGYSDRSRESAGTWAFSSPGSRHSEMAWSASSASHPHAHSPSHASRHHQHHHQHHADNGSGNSNGRHLSSPSSTSSSHIMKRTNMHIEASSPPSPASEQSSPSQTHSQSQYAYMSGTHANSRYRSGY